MGVGQELEVLYWRGGGVCFNDGILGLIEARRLGLEARLGSGFTKTVIRY